MTRSILFVSIISCALGSSLCRAQSPELASATQPNNSASAQKHGLTISKTVAVSHTIAGVFFDPMKCDASGNVYLRNLVDGVPGIHKVSTDGREVARFVPQPTDRDALITFAGYFSLGREGQVYQITVVHGVRKVFVYIYNPDRSFKTRVMLDTKFPWIPAQVAPVSSNAILVTGSEYDRDVHAAKWPFTGLFSMDGKLIKEIKFEDDDAIHDLAAIGDSRVVSPEAPTVNNAIGLGEMDVAEDGNVYLMRRLSPAILYAISPTGDVIRRFTVDPGEPNYMLGSLHVSGKEIAIQFYRPQGSDQLIKVVDLTGQRLRIWGRVKAKSSN